MAYEQTPENGFWYLLACEFFSICEILMLDSGAIEADICTVFVYQCRVKLKYLPKNLKPNKSPENLVLCTLTNVLGQLIQQIHQVLQQQIKYLRKIPQQYR